jgi:phage gpG-like protein
MARPFQGRIDIDTKRLNQILRDMPGNADTAVHKIAFEIEGKAKVSMAGEKSGRIYEVSPGVAHQASAPGEAPAIDTGNLVNSIQTEMIGKATAMVFTNTEYAYDLEFGAAHLAPRPFLQPAVSAVTSAVEHDPRRYFAAVVEG